MKVWITRYALSHGIFSGEATICDAGGGSMIKFQDGRYFHKPDWDTDEKLAIAWANVKRKRRIESAKKALRKLEDLTF